MVAKEKTPWIILWSLRTSAILPDRKCEDRRRDHMNFYVDKGEFCIIVGPSGAGKTTLLNILGGMDSCDEGHVWLDGRDVSRFSEKALTTYRRYDVGFVFQFYNLVQNLTALENVELASEICRDPLDRPRP